MIPTFYRLWLIFLLLLTGIAVLSYPAYAENSDLDIYKSNIQKFKNSLRSRPNDPNLHYNLGNNYWKLGQYEESIKHYKETLKIQPFDAEAHTGIGFVIFSTSWHWFCNI